MSEILAFTSNSQNFMLFLMFMCLAFLSAALISIWRQVRLEIQLEQYRKATSPIGELSGMEATQ